MSEYTYNEDIAIQARNLPDALLAKKLGRSKGAIQQRRKKLLRPLTAFAGLVAADERRALVAEEVGVLGARVADTRALLTQLESMLEAKQKQLAEFAMSVTP